MCKTASFRKSSAILSVRCRGKKNFAPLLHSNCVSKLRESAQNMHRDAIKQCSAFSFMNLSGHISINEPTGPEV